MASLIFIAPRPSPLEEPLSDGLKLGERSAVLPRRSDNFGQLIGGLASLSRRSIDIPAVERHAYRQALRRQPPAAPSPVAALDETTFAVSTFGYRRTSAACQAAGCGAATRTRNADEHSLPQGNSGYLLWQGFSRELVCRRL